MQISSACASCRTETITIYVLIRVSICRDDCLNRGGGNRNACTCDDDESESETCFDTMRTRKSQDDDDACCANSIELNFNEEGDDCTNQQNTLCSIDCQSEDDCATDNQDCGADVCESEDDACAQSTCNDCDNDDEDTCECDQEENCADDDTCAAEDNECECEEADNCADDNNCTDNNDCGNDDCENNDNCDDDNCNNDNCGDNEFDNNNCGTDDSTDDNCAGDDCAEDNCEENETDICADNDECAADKSEDLCQTNTGTLQSECSYRSEDGNSCLGGGSTIKCANCASAANQCNTNTIESAKSAQCNCAGDTGTLQSECSQGGCACGTMRSSYSCASEDSCAGNALCSGCANQMGTMKSNYSQSTVRSNSFECLNVAGDTDQSMANTWGKTDSFRPAQCGSSNQQGSCLVCMGTGTVRSRSAYADTMDSSYSQQYGNCAMESARSNYAPRTGTIRSQGSDSESDSEGDAKRSPPCFNICSCLGQTLIQL